MNHHGTTNNLNFLTHDRQTGFARGEEASFRRLRNLVNSLRKSCRPIYYESKVEQLRDCAPRRWWNEVKRHGGMQSATRTDLINFNCANDVTPVPHSKVKSEHRWLLHLSSCKERSEECLAQIVKPLS